MACTCQSCGKPYKVDLLVPDDIWQCIRPTTKTDGGGLLCGSCIMQRIEALGLHGALRAQAIAFPIPATIAAVPPHTAPKEG